MLFRSPVGTYSVKAYGKTSTGAVAAKCDTTVTIVAGETTTTTLHLTRIDHWTVTFLDNDGEEISTQEISDGYTATKPVNPAPLEGKNFSYWTTDTVVTDTSAPFSFNTPITGAITLRPVYGKITYTVTYVSAPKAVASDTYTIESSLTLPTPEQDGFVFKGWYIEEDCSGTRVYSLSEGNTGNITYYALWNVKVTMNPHNTTTDSSQEYEVPYGSTVAALPSSLASTTPTKTHAAFLGWFKSSKDDTTGASASSTEYDLSSTVTAPFSLHAKWDSTEITWVSPITLGTDYTADSGAYKEYPSTGMTLPRPVYTGLTFVDWYEDEDFTPARKVTSIAAGTTGEKTFYAKWTATVTFDSMGGSAVTAQEVIYNKKATSPSPTKTGLTLAGWYTSEDSGTTLSETAFDFDTEITENLTLYAKWGVSVSSLSTYLENLPAGDATTPNVLPAIAGLTTSNWTDIKTALRANSTKYVDLSATTLPDGITSMSEGFRDCTNLVAAPVIPDSATNMYCCFMGCTSLATAPVIPDGVTSIRSCFDHCTSLTAAPEIPDSVTNMKSCFERCTSLATAPTIPNSVTIMEYCFNGCTSLTTAPVIPSSVTTMLGTFRECTSLTTAPTIPSSVTNLQDCFAGCTSLTTAPTIEEGVTDMGGSFSRCTNLATAPVIPASVTNMYGCFQYCTGLTGEIVIYTELTNTNAGLPQWKQAFLNVPSSVRLKVKSTAVKEAIKEAGGNENFTDANISIMP